MDLVIKCKIKTFGRFDKSRGYNINKKLKSLPKSGTELIPINPHVSVCVFVCAFITCNLSRKIFISQKKSPFTFNYLLSPINFELTQSSYLLLLYISLLYFIYSFMTHSLMLLDISGNLFQSLPLDSLRNVHTLSRLIAQR